MNRNELNIEVNTLPTEDMLSNDRLREAGTNMAVRVLGPVFAIDDSLACPAIPSVITEEESNKFRESIENIVNQRSKIYRK